MQEPLNDEGLENLSPGQKGEPEAPAAGAGDSAYAKKRPDPPSFMKPGRYTQPRIVAYADSFPEPIRQWKKVIIGVTNVFCSELCSLTTIGDLEAFMNTLRSYTDTLDSLFKEMDSAKIPNKA